MKTFNNIEYMLKYIRTKNRLNNIYSLIAIVGESGSGKTTLANHIIKNNDNFERVITYTTRPMRNDEVDGIDYHFITKEKYDEMKNKNCFIEHSEYNGWYYGILYDSIKCTDKNKVIIVTPYGLRKIKNYYNSNVSFETIYINIDRRERLIRLLNRGDNIEEAYRRNLSDVGQYDGISDEVNWIFTAENINEYMKDDK